MIYIYRILWIIGLITLFFISLIIFFITLITYPIYAGTYYIRTGNSIEDNDNITYTPETIPLIIINYYHKLKP